MRILYITQNIINERGGGSLGAKKLYLGLSKLKQCELYTYSPDEFCEKHVLAKKTKLKDIASRLIFHSNFLYTDWIYKRKEILRINPDVIILSNSRLGGLAKAIKRVNANCKIITHIDNIEVDYCENYMNKYSGFKKYALKMIEKFCVKRDEKKSFKYSDYILFLTLRDLKRAKEYYDYKIKSSIMPVCLEETDLVFKEENGKMNLVFLASLWYEPNANGILWFIKNVWKDIYIKYKDVNLIIGGKNPTDNLMKYNGNDNIRVYPNFSSIEKVVPKNSIFISPVFDGAGMKVKVAEAISMGFPIVATSESLVGYEEVLNDNINNVIIEANTKLEFISSIDKLIDEYDGNLKILSKRLFKKYYSVNRVSDTLIDVLNTIEK